MPTFDRFAVRPVPARPDDAGSQAGAATARRPAHRPVQSFLFAHTPSVVVYDCPGR
ncbi:hypothetical protein HNP84_007922 [Thermocatellispora tengchongensis]|uniref:Uncharacterized protein n=1 Tax=Thermocatellispora tengchongensis TaxID=1073253 RepID=A0A840PGR6_9ACTN|nr:hypothetical protein [Thermocatellispora tengchongensis]MBB5138169.1 hypothetical protein [Thermocatellispora tengchongensis]